MFVQLLKEFLGRKVGERIDDSEADANARVAQQIAHPVSEDLITSAVQNAMSRFSPASRRASTPSSTRSEPALQNAQAKSRRNAVPIIVGEGGDRDTHGKTFGDGLVQVAILGNPNASPQSSSATLVAPAFGL
jgi:hypothetical protein